MMPQKQAGDLDSHSFSIKKHAKITRDITWKEEGVSTKVYGGKRASPETKIMTKEGKKKT